MFGWKDLVVWLKRVEIIGSYKIEYFFTELNFINNTHGKSFFLARWVGSTSYPQMIDKGENVCQWVTAKKFFSYIKSSWTNSKTFTNLI